MKDTARSHFCKEYVSCLNYYLSIKIVIIFKHSVIRYFLILSIFISISAKAQTEIGIALMPGLSTFSDRSEIVSYDYRTTFSYGLKVNHHINRFTISSGVIHLFQGNKLAFEESSVDNPEGTGETFDLHYHTKAFVIPLNLDYDIVSKPGSRFFIGLGLYTGYLYSEYQDNTSLNNQTIHVAGGQSFQMRNLATTDYDQFNDLYLAINAGIGWQKGFNENFSIQLRPNVLYQLRESLPKENYGWTNRLLSFNLDISLFYRFGEK